MTKVTVIAPVYNGEDTLHQFIESLKKQSLREIEIILVDDGSIDHSPTILDNFAAEDDRVKVIHKTNGGASSARNVGLEYANGEYVYIVDSDDWLENTAVYDLYNKAKEFNADIIYGDYYREYTDKRIKRKVFENEFCTDDKKIIEKIAALLNVGGSSVPINVTDPIFGRMISFGGAPWRAMIRRSIIHENDIKFDTRLHNLGEDILFMQYVYKYINKMAYISFPIYHYRKQENSLSHGFKSNLPELYNQALEVEKDFLEQHNSDVFEWKLFYFRVIDYIMRLCRYYYVNRDNPNNTRENAQEFRELINRSLYREAIDNFSLEMISDRKVSMQITLLKEKKYILFFLIKQILQAIK